MDEEKTFEVLGGYFEKDKSILKKIDDCEEAIKNVKDKNPNRAASYQNMLEDHLAAHKLKINEFYNKEKKFLLKSIIFIFVFDSCQDSGSRNPTSDIIKYMVDQDLLTTIVSCLKLNSGKLPDKRRDNTEKQEFLFQKMEEEELLLQCVLSILVSLNQDIKNCDKAKYELFVYFTESYFQGYCYYRDPETIITEDFDKIYKKDNAIRDLTIFASLFCLSVNERNLKISNGLGKVVNLALSLNKGTVENLMSLTAYVVAMFAWKDAKVDAESVKEFNSDSLKNALPKISDRNNIESIVGLLDSHILGEEDYSFIKGPLINVIKQWIDKAYSFIFKWDSIVWNSWRDLIAKGGKK